MKKVYNRVEAIKYATKWAYSRNPKYYNFDNVGGDCTNFISQCIYAGSKTMNFNKTNGWYYINGYSKSPSWSGVEFLYNFLLTNKKVGPTGIQVDKSKAELGDIVQFKFDKNIFSHSTIITDINGSNVFVTTHTNDMYNKNTDDYLYTDVRYIHIEKVL